MLEICSDYSHRAKFLNGFGGGEIVNKISS